MFFRILSFSLSLNCFNSKLSCSMGFRSLFFRVSCKQVHYVPAPFCNRVLDLTFCLKGVLHNFFMNGCFWFWGGFGYIKVKDSIRNALANLLLDVRDLRKAEGAIIHVEGGGPQRAKRNIDEEDRVQCWGFIWRSVQQFDNDAVCVTMVLTEVESPFQERRRYLCVCFVFFGID